MAETTQQTPQNDSALLSVLGISGPIPKDSENLNVLKEKLLVEQGKAKEKTAEEKRRAALTTAVKEGELYKAEREETEPLREELLAKQKERIYPPPTRDNFNDFATMFSVISALSFAVGGKGRNAGLGAMAALNGAIDGYNRGDKDAFDRNMKEYDKKLAEYKTSLEATREALRVVSDRAGLKTKEGRAALKNAELNDGGVAAALIAENKFPDAIKHIDNLIRRATAEEAKNQRTKDQRFLKELTYAEKSGFGRGSSALVEQNLGVQLPTKEADQVVLSAKSMGEAKQLAQEVSNDPTLIGRNGQIRQAFDRYIGSWVVFEKNPTRQNIEELQKAEGQLSKLDQKALVFAKRYASYLVTYERGLAGGARAFTVAFQARFNKLLSQDQFNPEGFRALMDDMRRESATAAAAITPGATFEKMQAMGDDIVRRGSGGSSQQAPAQTGPKEGDTSTSKSGKPIVFRNGNWEYQ